MDFYSLLINEPWPLILNPGALSPQRHIFISIFWFNLTPTLFVLQI